jgi:hypothetical protein
MSHRRVRVVSLKDWRHKIQSRRQPKFVPARTLPAIAAKAALLHAVAPQLSSLVEEIVDNMLRECC